VFPTAAPAGLPRDASPKPQASTPRPAAGIQRVLRDLRPRARVLAVVSGKGGVGKTSLAVNLAIGLAAAGRRILLLDADIGLANVDLLLGQRPRGHLGHVLTGRMTLADVVQEGPAGIAWIPGASQMPALARIGQKRRDAVLEGLSDLETQHDLIVLDAPAGIGPGVLALARQADELVLVTTPEPTSIVDAYALLKAAAASGAPGAPGLGQIRLVVNMVAHRRDVERVHTRASARPRGVSSACRWASWDTFSATATSAAPSTARSPSSWPIRTRRPLGASRGSFRPSWRARRPKSERPWASSNEW